ncbi:MAG: hypothetical protein IJU16_01270 [Clostridia bacterium]|nr:hypothetical protein [Clostridia bacterium]
MAQRDTTTESRGSKKPMDPKVRKRLERQTIALTLIVVVPFLCLLTLFLLVFPRSTVSQIEKRDLATFPALSLESLLSGEFTRGVTEFYDDTVPFRDAFKNMGNQFKGLFGFAPSEDDIRFVDSPAIVKPKNDATADTATTTAATTVEGAASRQKSTTAAATTTTVPVNPYTKEEAETNWSNGLIVVKQDGHYRAMELFGGGGGTAYADALNALRASIGANVRIYSMPAPLASEFYTPLNAQDYTVSQSDCFNGVAAKLNGGITAINVCGALSAHASEPIYCRTDHHWQPLGAYYAAAEFAKAAGVPFADLSAYTQGANSGFVGTMYAFTDDSRILNDPEDFVYYVPKASYTADYYDLSFLYEYTDDLFAEVDTDNSYLMFMGGDSRVVQVNTGVKNGRTLLVIKDSYGNAEIPFYTSSFETIYVADMRYFECNLVDFINKREVTDVLFTMSAFSLVGDNADHLSALLSQSGTVPAVTTTTLPPTTDATEPTKITE